MFGLFTSTPDHPFADPRAARRVCAELAAHEPRAALEEAGNWLASLTATEGFKPAQRIELALQLDEAVVGHARRLGRDYLRQTQPQTPAHAPAEARSPVSRTDERRLWENCHGYWSQLATTYADALARVQRAEKEAEAAKAAKARLPLLLGRLCHALAARLKWAQFRYGPIEPAFWAELGGVYLAAVEARLAHKPLALHAGLAETTVEADYLKALVFQASSMDTLPPLEIDLAERLIAHFLPHFALVRELRPDSVYWVDAAKPLPPTRLAKLPEVTPTLRFFNGAQAVEAVRETLAQIEAAQRVPPEIALGGAYAPAVVVPVLQHLALCWAPTPPMRAHVRHRVASRLRVSHGLTTVHRRLGDGAAQQAGGAAEVESWRVEDISLGGLGAQLTVPRNDWIRIGTLLGVQPEGGDNWLLGVVRRYARSSPSEAAVGIETLSKTPRAVVADAGGLQTEAILLDVPVVGEYARMVLAPEALEDKVALLFRLDGLGARLHPRETLEVGEDFVVANFFVQSFS